MGDFSIQISSDLINQLSNNSDKLKKKTKKIKPKLSPQPQRPQTTVEQKQVYNDSEKHQGTTAGAGWGLQPPYFLPVNPPAPAQATFSELDAIQSVLKESERVVEKLKKQEENMVNEVTEKAKDLRDKEFKLPAPKPMPCLKETDACVTCYKENANDPLKCAHLTKTLSDCARRVRQLVTSADKVNSV